MLNENIRFSRQVTGLVTPTCLCAFGQMLPVSMETPGSCSVEFNHGGQGDCASVSPA